VTPDDTDERGEEYVARQRGGDHLPECRPQPWNPYTGAPCICDRLRACEARVREADAIEHRQILNERLPQEWNLALTAAREAVATCDPGWPNLISRDVALAAIDALRGES
jgi:hypothetical protein